MPKHETPSTDIRRRLLAGEPLTSAGVAEDYGVTAGLLSTTIRGMELGGAVIDREPYVNGKRGATLMFRVSKPKPDPALADTWGPDPAVRKLGKRGTRPAKRKPRSDKGRTRAESRAVANTPAGMVRAAVNGNGFATAHPVPALGENVQVFLLALGEDGRVNVGLRDGDQTWLTTVDGFSAGG